ncbi:unnamed protein product [Cuscuta campestris]|uniref:Uncharacterized protein n=1 Tax=Cuscuta campestris TaxID=132261 RepID=A0A484NNE6_9ASTE|nr:unnamed protein product [Cuscuta campestris]
MGETAVSSDGGVGGGAVELDRRKTEGMELLPAAEQRKAEEGDGSGPAAAEAMVRWERFLPKMVLRVLLVESDDSTRQIIAALLRKCSYKVAAVGDGLKAWEVLKRRPRNVDLILTEVDLPSISGYALLTLIMEHEICKNVPVIMMSAHDSISTVYKCMLGGAVDFLVKPLRKNELRNLWQHVWRRQVSSRSGHGQGEESVVQPKVEATAENDAFSNHSSGFEVCIERNRECIEKGSDAQSSCTKPEIQEPHPIALDVQLRDPDNQVEVASGEDMSSYEARMASSKQAMSLIGSFDNYTKCNYVSGSNVGENKVASSSPPLELSLKRYPSGSVNQFPDEKHRLKHSDVSAFTRYVSKGAQHRELTNQQKDDGHNSDSHGPTMSSQRHLQTPVSNGVRFDGLSNNSYGFMASSLQCPVSATPQSSFQEHPFNCFNNQAIHSHQQCNGLSDHNVTSGITQTEYQQGFSSKAELGHVPFPTDQSANNNICNGVMNCHYPSIKPTTEYRMEDVSAVQDGNSQKLLRQAALNKFRLKRKDRCFEKKVRYESRKKLAEQRPRVKGQFVRQFPSEPPPGDASTG